MTFRRTLLFKHLGIILVTVGNYRTHPEHTPIDGHQGYKMEKRGLYLGEKRAGRRSTGMQDRRRLTRGYTRRRATSLRDRCAPRDRRDRHIPRTHGEARMRLTRSVGFRSAGLILALAILSTYAAPATAAFRLQAYTMRCFGSPLGPVTGILVGRIETVARDSQESPSGDAIRRSV